MENRGEYVKFSKEKHLLDAPSEKLRRELEEELKLSSSNMLSHGWYHGHIPWEVSETLVLHDGDFLIRDSLTSVGDYVLTSRWNQKALHFLISKVLVKSSDTYSCVQYILEGEPFDSVPALVHFYIVNPTPLTQQSGAHIYSPITRTLPLRYLEAAFALANCKASPVNSPSRQRGAYIKRQDITVMDGLRVEDINPYSSPSTIHHKEAVRSCSTLDQRVGEAPLSPALNSINRHRSPSGNRQHVVVPSSPVLQTPSEIQLGTSSDNPIIYLEPTASIRSSPTHPCPNAHTGSNNCGEQPSSAPGPPSPSPLEHLWVGLEGQAVDFGREEKEEGFILPVVETTSSFRPSRYESPLLPKENKPLETSVLRRVKEVLTEVDTQTVAMHMTKADCTVARILGVTDEMQRRMGVSSGMELLTLPHGHQLCQDLLERFHTMAIVLAVVLLGCTGSVEERAALLHRSILLAQELNSTLGNMFGFAAVMRALELSQVSRLEKTWVALRQRHTESAVLYEKTLKPFLRSMNDGKESCVPSSPSFPHVLPFLSLLERSVPTGEGEESWESVDAGVDAVLIHLEAARTIARHGEIYRTNAETSLQGFQEKPEVLEVFLTEFQMRLLWGSRGVEGSRAERYEKFDKVLTALSNKLEPPHTAQ